MEFTSKFGSLVSACILVMLTACSASSSGPSEELVIETIKARHQAIDIGMGNFLKDYIQFDTASIADKRIEGDKAIVIAKASYTCLKDWKAGTMAEERVGPYAGNGACAKGEKRTGETKINFLKFESGWRADR